MYYTIRNYLTRRVPSFKLHTITRIMMTFRKLVIVLNTVKKKPNLFGKFDVNILPNNDMHTYNYNRVINVNCFLGSLNYFLIDKAHLSMFVEKFFLD